MEVTCTGSLTDMKCLLFTDPIKSELKYYQILCMWSLEKWMINQSKYVYIIKPGKIW